MSTERNTSSVLAKLMGIDRRLPPSKTDGKRRVFSENYLQNVSSVIHMEKSTLDATINVFSMDDSDHVECDAIVECSETGSVDDLQVLLRGSVNSGVVTYSGDLRMKNKWNEVTFPPKIPNYGERSPTRSYVVSGHSAIQSSSRGSKGERHKSIEARLQQPRSFHQIDKTRQPYLKSYLGSAKFHSSLFSGISNKQYTGFGVRNNRLGLHKRRMDSLHHNRMDTTVCENMPAKEIAKRVINQVNHSVWHSSVKGCRSHTSFSATSKRLDSKNVQKSKKTRLESWRAIKFPQERITCRGRKSPNKFDAFGTSRSNYNLNSENGNPSIVNANFNHSRVTNARYLSNPTFFPSAWVPRSKKRCFTLDRNWLSRPGDKNSNDLFNESFDNVGDTNVKSHCDPSLEENIFIHDHKLSRDVDNNFSPDISVVAIHSNCISVPPCVKNEEGTLDEKMGVSVKLSKNILVDDASRSQKNFVLKHELKSTTSPPRSPVSSLEGPEACRTCLNFSFKSKEISIPQCLHDDLLGLQRKLNLIEAISTESSFEGPGMVVSSDASDGGGSTGYREDSQICELTSESCNFSYLVDVLVESGIMNANLEAGKGKWYSANSVLDPSTFNFLEKKYGKSTRRERSERRLFFDRINSGLEETVWPFVGIYSWRKPVVKRLSFRRSHQFIEEEIWALLVNQEHVNGDLSDEVCLREMEWLDLEDLDFSEEIQSLLIDELVEEFVIEAVVR